MSSFKATVIIPTTQRITLNIKNGTNVATLVKNGYHIEMKSNGEFFFYYLLFWLFFIILLFIIKLECSFYFSNIKIDAIIMYNLVAVIVFNAWIRSDIVEQKEKT